jgi:hypothetical protein
MFKELAEKLRRISKNHSVFDPSRFDDPVAMQTDWTPARGGGTNFRTHKLVEISPDRLEFQTSLGARLFYLVFLLAGTGILAGFSVSGFFSGSLALDMDTLLPMGIGLVFAIAGACLLYFGTAPVVFDRRTGFFWKGRTAPGEVFDNSTLKHCAELKKIYALQLISEYCSGNKSSYYSYELNLVLDDGRRINVIDHGNKNKLREDAGMVSAFLEKPVWDAISGL